MLFVVAALLLVACPIAANRAEESDKSDDSGAAADTADSGDALDTADSGEDTDTDCDLVWYYDGDHDGFGDPTIVNGSCEAPVGYVGDNTDCDDARSDVYPGAIEVCDQTDQDCDIAVDEDASDLATFYADEDHDGFGDYADSVLACAAPTDFVSDATDCDDSDGTVYPGATETCDGTDQDCDGSIDENALGADIWFEDLDADGYGNPSVSTDACAQPSGYVADDDDCDDANGYVNPAADELCDGVDQDCDGNIDEGAVDQSIWYLDIDGDGYGTDTLTYLGCEPVTGYVAENTDCDDDALAISPDATEMCDGVDNDCDGTIDIEAADPEIWYRDGDGDGYGDDDGSSMAAACDVPLGYVANSDDCDDSSAASFPGGIEVCGGEDENCDGTTDEDTAGDALYWYVDADSDGYGSGEPTTSCVNPGGLVDNVGDCDDAESTISPAEIEACDDVLDNDCNGLVDDGCGPSGALTTADADASVEWTSFSGADNAKVVKQGGDLFGTGSETILAGAGAGYVWLVAAPAAGAVDPSTIITVGDSAKAIKGFDSGDWDGDGNEDLAFAATTGSTAFVFYGPVTASISGDAATIADVEPGSSSAYGTDLHFVDLNDDGRDDLVSCLRGAGTEIAWVDLAPYAGSLGLGSSGGPTYLDQCDAGPDIDGDGIGDLLFDFSLTTSSTSILSGADATAGSFSLTTDAAVTLVGEYHYDVALLPDTNGDGYADLALGEGNTNAYTGEVELWLGPPSAMASGSAAATLSGPAVDAYAGSSVGHADVDGDNLADILVGGTQGEVWLQYSPVLGTVNLGSADASWSGFTTGYDPLALAGADLTGTGQDSIVIGDPDMGYYGALYLFNGGGR